jgi:MFS family permease
LELHGPGSEQVARSLSPALLIRQGLTVTRSFGYSLFITVAQIPGFYSAAFLNEKLDRKWTIILYMIGGGISAFFMSGAREPASIMLFGVLLSFFMSGIAACIYAYTPEVYPTAFRATGMGVASAVGRLGGIAAPIVIGLACTRIGFAQCCKPETESVMGCSWSDDYAAASPSRRSTNAACPAMSFFGNHFTCPLRIMFTVSIP